MRTARHATSSRRKWLGALAAGVALLLSGCGQIYPGAAVVVGDTRIGHDRVTDVAHAICAVNLNAEQLGSQQAITTSRGARDAALQLLLDTELSLKFGEVRDVEPDMQVLSQALAANENTISLLDEQNREIFRQAVRDYIAGQLILIQVGRDEIGAEIGEQEAIAEGSRQRAEFARDLEIEVDPRYGEYVEGAVRRGGTELSVPASAEARQGARAQPGQGFVADLPPSQQCR